MKSGVVIGVVSGAVGGVMIKLCQHPIACSKVNNQAQNMNFVASPSTVNTQENSRRGPGYSMTSSAQQMPLPAVQTPVPQPVTHISAPLPSAPPESPTTSPPITNFKTVLITDSIMRHINNKEDLGVNHELYPINVRDSSGLNRVDVKRTIETIRPDYIYIHLGANDAFQNIPLRESLKNYLCLKKFVDWLFNTKIIISLPLFTKDTQTNRKILDLREGLKEFSNHFHESHHTQCPKTKKIWVNANTNFCKNGLIAEQYYGNDGVHLTDRGKDVIKGNLRHHIHHITRIMQNKPPKQK